MRWRRFHAASMHDGSAYTHSTKANRITASSEIEITEGPLAPCWPADPRKGSRRPAGECSRTANTAPCTLGANTRQRGANMDDVNKLLDRCRDVCGVPTDMALAAALHVTRATVSGWRHGARYPDAVACARIADMLGIPVGRVLGIVGEARAISRDEKQVWRRLATTAVLALATLAMNSTAIPTASASVGNRQVPDDLYIMRISGPETARRFARSPLTPLPLS